MKSQSHQQMAPVVKDPNADERVGTSNNAGGPGNKENKLTVLKPADSIDRKEFDKMLKNIYVKQGYHSINSVQNQNSRKQSFFDKRNNPERSSDNSNLISGLNSEAITPANNEYIQRSESQQRRALQ